VAGYAVFTGPVEKGRSLLKLGDANLNSGVVGTPQLDSDVLFRIPCAMPTTAKGLGGRRVRVTRPTGVSVMIPPIPGNLRGRKTEKGVIEHVAAKLPMPASALQADPTALDFAS
jgi:hypothetical protein